MQSKKMKQATQNVEQEANLLQKKKGDKLFNRLYACKTQSSQAVCTDL